MIWEFSGGWDISLSIGDEVPIHYGCQDLGAMVTKCNEGLGQEGTLGMRKEIWITYGLWLITTNTKKCEEVSQFEIHAHGLEPTSPGTEHARPSLKNGPLQTSVWISTHSLHSIQLLDLSYNVFWDS